MSTYSAHNLTIHSSIEFPELKKSKGKKDLTIKYGSFSYSDTEIQDKGIFRIASQYILTKDGVFLNWNNIDICQIRSDEIIINPDTGIEDNFLRSLILGPAVGINLHLKGRMVLHSSTIKVNEAGVGFVGHNGAGKSTTTVSFLKNGHPLVADDVSSLEFINNIPLVYPGIPRIKLWPEARKLWGEKLDCFPIHSQSTKMSCVVENFHEKSIPLKHIYVIERSKSTHVEDISPQEGLIELIRNSYCANIFSPYYQKKSLNDYSKLVKKISLKKLCIEQGLDKLDNMVQVVMRGCGF
ncbi:MAG: hypothetical protein KKF16_09050 [Euryarchaeota archaeon]|nr:hypothetical protein [Euryarchaeota archaeon]MBU4607594.1 hypothetical protein [Euryarchaeota archaeon]MBV1729407.1 hypothetical protein [Methanobacterium sp.]MBV1755111.1 hypothetical protein [Methanobacterium sp.]